MVFYLRMTPSHALDILGMKVKDRTVCIVIGVIVAVMVYTGIYVGVKNKEVIPDQFKDAAGNLSQAKIQTCAVLVGLVFGALVGGLLRYYLLKAE